MSDDIGRSHDIGPAIIESDNNPPTHNNQNNQTPPGNKDPTPESVAPKLKDVNAPYGLNPAERKWSRIQQSLERLGYMLRPRYHPGWVGAWVGTRKSPDACEDSIEIGDPGVVIDAVRVEDGRQVLLKLWSRDTVDGPELDVLEYFSDPVRADHSSNHVVPLIDTLVIEGWERFFDKILVEPLLRDWKEPPFVMVAEALLFVLQVMEGLDYMHENNVAHGDIHSGNILMTPAPLFPKGFHGAFNLNTERRVSEKHLNRRSRLQAPVKYYYIDFGSSVIFPSTEERKLVELRPAVWRPPEYSANKMERKPVDPFKADIYALAVTLSQEMKHRPGLHFILPLFELMLADNPDIRPTAAEVKADFVRLLSTLKPSAMRRRIGWSRKSGITVTGRLWDAKEYLKLLWHSYKYGLPKELFPGKLRSQ